mmetsp:Transcript_95203/g.208200  ORF Transcript_95203/g.208200 Transcript_95203/m.208200 type:complete len:617 (+) Transcript_95203:56-1906(+)
MGASASGTCGGNSCGCNRDCGDVANYLSRPEPYAHAPNVGQGTSLPNAWPPLNAWGIVNGLDEEHGGSAPSEPLGNSKRWRNKEDESMDFPPSPRAVHEQKVNSDEKNARCGSVNGHKESNETPASHSPAIFGDDASQQSDLRLGEVAQTATPKHRGGKDRSVSPHHGSSEPGLTARNFQSANPKSTGMLLLLPGVTKTEYGGGGGGSAATTARSASPAVVEQAHSALPPSTPAPAAPPSSRPTECLLISFSEANATKPSEAQLKTSSRAAASQTLGKTPEKGNRSSLLPLSQAQPSHLPSPSRSPSPSPPSSAVSPSPLAAAPAAAAETQTSTAAAAAPAPAAATATATPTTTTTTADPTSSPKVITSSQALAQNLAPVDASGCRVGTSATVDPRPAPSDPSSSPREGCLDDPLNRSQATTSAAISDGGGGVSESSSEAHSSEIPRAEIHGMRLFHISATDIRPPPPPPPLASGPNVSSKRSLSASPVQSKGSSGGGGGGSSRRGVSPKAFLIEGSFPPLVPGSGAPGDRVQLCSSQRDSSPSASPPDDDDRRSQTFGDITSMQDKPSLPQLQQTTQLPRSTTPRKASKDSSGGRKKPKGGMGTRATRADQLLSW